MKKTFEQKLNSPFYKYSKRIFELIALNIIFCVVSLLSLFVLFFPGLVSLHKIIYNYISDNDDNVYKTFFMEIKNQWSFSWRLEILCISIVLIVGTLFYFDIYYIKHVAYNWIGWFALVFLVSISIVFLSIYFNLMLFNDYYKEDTFFVMIKKSAVITLRKKLLTFLNLIIFISFVIVLYLIPFLIPFVSFTFFIYILQAINKKTFTTIAREEYERSLLPENLFLPVVKEDEEK